MPILRSSRFLRGIRSRTVLTGTALILAVAACDSALAPLIGLFLSQPTVHFRAVRGSSALLTQSITVSNSGGGRLGPVTCPANPANWLICAVANGNVVTLTANATGLNTSPPPVTVPLEAPGVSESTSLLVDLVIEEPVIGLSSGALAFTAVENSSVASPSPGTVTVTNAGAGSLANLGGISCVPNPPTGRVSCSVNQSNGVLSVSIDPVGLAPGTHVFPLSVTAPNATSPATLTATLNLAALPRIVLSSRTVHFSAIRGSVTPLITTVAVTNSGSGSLGTLTCSALASWLNCTVSGSTLTLTVNPGTLTASPGPATVNVNGSGAANNPQTITATMAVEQPLLGLDTNAATFTAVEGLGEVTPLNRTIQIRNVGAGTVNNLGTISCIATAPVTCVVNSSVSQLTLSIDPAAVAVGTAVHVVTVRASNSSIEQPIAVLLTVAPRPTLVLTPPTLVFRVPVGSTAPLALSVTASNSGGGTLGDVTCPPSPAIWLTCSVSFNQIVLTAFPAGLLTSPTPVGVPVTAANAPNDPKVLQVELQITHSMALDVNTVAFSGSTSTGVSTPASRPVMVTNASGGTLAALGVIGCQAPTRVSCTVNQLTGQVDVFVNPIGLPLGAQPPMTVNITTQYGTNSPLPVTVNLTVTP